MSGDLIGIRNDILKRINEASSLVILSHYNPDADAYGSSLGLAHSLRAIGKQVTVVNETGQIERYRSLPGLDAVQRTIPDGIDVVVACDCGAIQRVGDSLVSRVKAAATVINIDHHVSNDNFGAINLVDTLSSSTSEIIFDLIRQAQWPLPTESAVCLLGGIIGDTGSFRYSSAKPKTFRVAADLMEAGASPTEIFASLYGSPPVSVVKLQAEIMAALELSFDGRFAEAIVPEELLKKYGSSLDDIDGLAERARDIKGVKIAASLRQDGSLWRVSLRSVDAAYNVSEIASSFGGGGHVQAAAFRISKPLSVVRENLRKKIAEVLT